jgi:hypothetical protein
MSPPTSSSMLLPPELQHFMIMWPLLSTFKSLKA